MKVEVSVHTTIMLPSHSRHLKRHPAASVLTVVLPLLAACGGRVHVEADDEARQPADFLGGELMCQVGEPDDACNACTRRAIEGACSALLESCHAEDGNECVAFGQCQFECFEDEACCSACASELPAGFSGYAALQTCSVCEQCATECEGLFPMLCSG